MTDLQAKDVALNAVCAWCLRRQYYQEAIRSAVRRRQPMEEVEQRMRLTWFLMPWWKRLLYRLHGRGRNNWWFHPLA